MHTSVRTALLALLLLMVSGCGVIDYFLLPPPEDTAQELFEAGQDAMKEKEYSRAAEYFARLKDRYPFSPYTPQAEIALGDAYFLDEDYSHAADAYREFETLHPRHEQIPYILFQIGKSLYRQFRSIDMPQAHVAEAVEHFTRLAEAYPDSKYTPEAREYVVKCRRYMAEHEVFVADFYWRSAHYSSAWRRYRYVSETFTDLPDVAQYAARRAELAYLRAQEDASQAERERVQGSWKQWFDWL
ncbi:MAG: outer membrane protein assembly factor BamD [Thermodesulfobacteriota bacterium]